MMKSCEGVAGLVVWGVLAGRVAAVVAVVLVVLSGVLLWVPSGAWGGVSLSESSDASLPLIGAALVRAEGDLAAGVDSPAVLESGGRLVVVPSSVVSDEPVVSESSWGHAVPEWVASADENGWMTFHFEHSGDVRIRLVGRGVPSAVDVSGNTAFSQGVLGVGVDESVVADSRQLETFLTVDDAWPFPLRSFEYEFDLPEGVVAVQGEGGPITIRQRGGFNLLTIVADEAKTDGGSDVPLVTELADDGSGFSVTAVRPAGSTEPYVVDPNFRFASTGVVDKVYCYHGNGGSTGCNIDSDADIADWQSTGTNSSKFNAGRDNARGLYIGNKSSTTYVAGDYMQYANKGWASESADYLLITNMVFEGNVVNGAGIFKCRALVKPKNGSLAQYAGSWRSTNGDFTQTFNYADSGNNSNGRFGWGGFQWYANSGGGSYSNNANVCRNQAIADSFVFTLRDSKAPSSVAPASVSHTATAQDMDFTASPNQHWYKSGDTVNVWYDVDDRWSGTLTDTTATPNQSFTMSNASGLGIWRVGVVTGGVERSTANVCGDPNASDPDGDGSATHPCDQQYTGYHSVTLNGTNSPTQGANTIANNGYDFAKNITTSTSSTYYYDSVAPSTISVSNLDNAHTDGTAVLSWPAPTEATSGIDHYEYKLWLDGVDEAYSDGWHSTGSSEPFVNVRLGTVTESGAWTWKWRVRAVDRAGNVSTQSSIASVGYSSPYTANGLLGSGYGASAGSLGGGVSVGHATGNVSVSGVDMQVQGYGASMSVERTYNHRDSDRTYSLRQVSGSLDAPSGAASWNLGVGTTTGWERRLVRGDDGSTYGHGAADSGSPIRSLTYVDESGSRWPFTPTSSAATAFVSPDGFDGALSHTAASPAGPEGDSYSLAFTGGSTLTFDDYGRLLVELLPSGRSVTYVRDSGNGGRVSSIRTDDPDGAGSEQPLALDLEWGAVTIGGATFGASDQVATVTDAVGRQVRYQYETVSGSVYLTSVQRFADASSTSALTRTDYTWGTSCGTASRVICGVHEWVYADDPATGSGGADPLKHSWAITYNTANMAVDVVEVGTAARSVGTSSESIPAVADTHHEFTYTFLLHGGSASMNIFDTSETNAADGAGGFWVDDHGRDRVIKFNVESGATTARQNEVVYSPEGEPAIETDDQGNTTTRTFDSAGRVTQELVDAADTSGGAADSLTEYANYTSDDQAQTETEYRSTFIGSHVYALNTCVDTGSSGTFKVTTAGTSGDATPTWPTTGAITSGTATLTKQTCTPSSQSVETTYEFDGDGNEIEQQDASGVRTCTYYTASGDIDVEYQLDGAECPTTPDTSARIKGTLTDNTYNARGWLTQATTDTQTTKYTTNDAGQTTQTRVVVDSSDASKDIVTDTLFDGAGRQVRVTTTESDSTQRSVSTTYTMTGDVSTRIVPNAAYPTGLAAGVPVGDETRTYLDARGRGYLTVLPDSTITTSRHDVLGRATWVSVPHAQANGSPAATVETYYYSGALKSKTDPAGIVTQYDPSTDPPGAEQPVRIDSPVAGTTTLSYTDSGDVAEKTTPAGTVSNTYDGGGNLTGVSYPSGATRLDSFDSDGNATQSVFTPSGGSAQSTSTAFTADGKVDTQNQPTVSGDPNGLDSDYTYSTSTGQLEKTVLDEDNTSWFVESRFAYDAIGRVASITTEDGASDPVVGYSYADKSGRLSEVDRPDGSDDRYEYDEQGRVAALKVVKDADSSWQGGDAYAYDAQGRITTRTRREAGTSHDTTYAYDPAGQLVSETSEHGIVRSYVYGDANADAFGTDMQRQTLHTTSAPSGALTLARVDELDTCLTTTTCAASDASAIGSAIDDLLAPGSLTDPAALTSSAADVARYLKLRSGQSWTANAAVSVGACITPSGWSGAHYEATVAGTSGATAPTWPSSGTVADGGVTWAVSSCTPTLIIRRYEYDTSTPSKHQLVKQYDRTGIATYYHYDTRGNQDYRGATAYVSTPNQSFDELNRATSLKDDTGSTVTLSWYRDEYRLKSWSAGGTTRALQYDADGRLRQITATGAASWTSQYQYDAAGLASLKTSGNWYYLDRSQRGDITAIRDNTGALQATIRYTAWGEIWTDNQTLLVKLAHNYDGRDGVIDLGSGLLSMRARMYSAAQARFVATDSVDGREGTLQSAYNYADGDPVDRIDPNGTTTEVCLGWGDIPSWSGKHITALGEVICGPYEVDITIRVCLLRRDPKSGAEKIVGCNPHSGAPAEVLGPGTYFVWSYSHAGCSHQFKYASRINFSVGGSRDHGHSPWKRVC